MLLSPLLLTWKPLARKLDFQLSGKDPPCNQDTNRRARVKRKGLNGKAALRVSHGPEGLFGLCSSWELEHLQRHASLCARLATALPTFSSCQWPPKRASTPTTGGGKGGGPELGEICSCQEQAHTKVPPAGPGGRDRDLVP